MINLLSRQKPKAENWTMIKAEDGTDFDLNDADNQQVIEKMLGKSFKGLSGYSDDHVVSYYILLERYLKQAKIFENRERILGYLKAVARIHYLSGYLNARRRLRYEIASSDIMSVMQKGTPIATSRDYQSYNDQQLDCFYSRNSDVNSMTIEDSMIMQMDLADLLDGVHEKDQYMLSLIIDEYRHIDIARDMGLKANTAFTMVNRLKKKLRTRWREQYEAQ
jgi:DNA-directed RNA polymerase specialized sigma24 family protein